MLGQIGKAQVTQEKAQGMTQRTVNSYNFVITYRLNHMLTSLRSIGNSRGVLIPAAFLSSCQMEGEVDMQLQDGQIILRPVHRAPRAGWFDNATSLKRETTSVELADWAALPVAQNSDDAEWIW